VPQGTGPGLGAPDASGDRQSLLGKVPDGHAAPNDGPLEASSAEVCAVVYDDQVGINFDQRTGNLKGATLGTACVPGRVGDGECCSRAASVAVRIRDASQVCRGPFACSRAAEAPLEAPPPARRRPPRSLDPRRTRPIGAVPNWVTFTPDSRLLYISNARARSVSVIDTKAMKSVATVPVGEVPKRIQHLGDALEAIWRECSAARPQIAARGRPTLPKDHNCGSTTLFGDRMDTIKPLFTVTATATGGRNGYTETSDGVVKANLSVPKKWAARASRARRRRAPVRRRLRGMLRRGAGFHRKEAQEGCFQGPHHLRRVDRSARLPEASASR